jgi:GNAT superfamily N-acetyltransferase
MVSVRSSRPGDIDALVGVHVRSARDGYSHIFPPEAPFPSDESIAARWQPALVGGATTTAFVAEIDDVVVGGAIADLAPSERGFGNLRHLYVEPSAWGRGAGRALHDAVVGWCRSAGLHELELWVLVDNRRARGMYERWGWRLDPGERLVHDGLDVTEVRYVLARVDPS